MNAARRKRNPHPLAGFVTRFFPFLQGGWRRVIAALLLAGLLAVGLLYAWGQWGGQITRGEAYTLAPEQIELTPPPPWVRANVKDEVVRDMERARLSLLDRLLTVQVAQAFATHPWVEKVVRVSKHQPPRVMVEVLYRKPVAMVEVVTRGQPGLLPIDANGVLLPPADFAPEQAREYLRIAATDATPPASVGMAWGDPRIHGGARIANLLQHAWKNLGLYRITAHRPDPAVKQMKGLDEPTFELLTRKGVRVLWGAAPAADNPVDTATAQNKISRLVSLAQASGGLDSETGPAEIDLRTRTPDPRTALSPPTSRRQQN
jgi:hypothetical protein